jgi:Tfp pilus assembly protein PilF
MQAYQDYLRGRYLFIQRGAPALRASLAAFQSAVALDPEFTEAWAAMSVTAATLGGWDQANAEATDQIALDAGNHALRLDPNSATAMAGLGQLYSSQGNWQRSLELSKRASELSKDSTPTYFYGIVLLSAGYISEAQQTFLQAERLDPVYPQLQVFLGTNAMALGDLAAARNYFQRAIDGGNSNGISGMFWLELETGNAESAIAYLEEYTALVAAGQASGMQRQSAEAISAAIRDHAHLQNGIEAALLEGNVIALNYFGAEPEIARLLNSDLASGTTLRNSLRLAFHLWAPAFSGLRQLPEYKQFLRDFGLVALWKERGWPDLCKPVGEDDFACK